MEDKAREIANGKGLGCLDRFARYHLIVAIAQALAREREAALEECKGKVMNAEPICYRVTTGHPSSDGVACTQEWSGVDWGKSKVAIAESIRALKSVGVNQAAG